jgi:hypothetical protein
MTVDEFVKARVLPQHQDIVVGMRQLMREMAPDATETIAYGIPMYKRNRIFAYISPTKKDITFGFSRGAEFEDRYGLLKGVGKSAKNIKLKRLEDVNKEVLGYYIKQSPQWDDK